ncbi:hypothetical protein ACFXKC_28455 [Streptomyces sp. NPDC059340]|uniref:hypothetical protein n=1 Tax=Streptomyces sp. NPDC059340 TaxID=3346806 RepID=UPI0036D14A5B
MKRHPFLRLLAQAALSGAAGAAVVNAVWFVATGETPPLMVALLGAEAVTTAWSLVQAARFRRKWQTVLASYNQPALGEGIDIPHRPPTDEEPTA